MGLVEIIILLAGLVVFTVSFFITDTKGSASEETRILAREEIKEMVSKEFGEVKGHVEDVVNEAVSYAVEKTERSLERLTNEKIMAVNEYSDTVLKEIHKNHEEALFLYDMLNSKHINLKDTVSKVNQTVKEAEETTKEVEAVVSSFQKLAPERVIFEATLSRPETAIERLQRSVEMEIEMEQEKITESEEWQEAEQDNSKVSFMQDTEGDKRNNNVKILELHRQGKSNVAIAKELGLGVGEVKLVIDLFKNI